MRIYFFANKILDKKCNWLDQKPQETHEVHRSLSSKFVAESSFKPNLLSEDLSYEKNLRSLHF